MRLTLVTDGTTDQALLPILRWMLRQSSTTPFEMNWAAPQVLQRAGPSLRQRVVGALALYPCQILVVHRDAEREPLEKRLHEIEDATRGLPVPVVSAVPVRMTEAWLLFDERAVRRAAGCPNGTAPLVLQPKRDVESIADPKRVLHDAMLVASNLSGRRLKHFRPDIRRLSDLIDDFRPLRDVPSFCAFEASLRAALLTLGILRSEHRAPPDRE